MTDDVLVDPLPERDIQLSPTSLALCRALDGEHDLEAIFTGLTAAGHARADVEVAFRRLLLVHAVEGAGDATVARVDQIAHGQTRLPLVILDGARFECQGSGACCRNYRLGPIYDDDVERIEALPHDQPGPYFAEGADGERHLATVDNRCIFLDAEERCRLHLRFGGDVKPRICRLYPLEFQATIAGLRLGDKGSCARFATSARRGPALDEDLQRLAPLLAGIDHELQHPIVTVDGVPCDYGIALAFGKVALGLARQNQGTVATTLAAIGDGLGRLRAALASCPLEPGEPDRTVAAVLAGAPSWAASTAPTDEALDLVVEISPDTRQAMRDHASVRVDDLDVDAVLRLSLRQQLFGQRAVLEHRVAAGLLRIALIQILSVWGARRAAAAAGRSHVVADDLSRPHALAVRSLETARAELVLADGEPVWRTLVPALPALLDLGYRRPMP